MSQGLIAIATLDERVLTRVFLFCVESVTLFFTSRALHVARSISLSLSTRKIAINYIWGEPIIFLLFDDMLHPFTLTVMYTEGRGK